MAKKPPERSEPDAEPPRGLLPVNEAASAGAPFLYFDEASAFGLMNGMVRVTLEAVTMMPDGSGGVVNERVVTAHLRMNLSAARSLKTALDGVVLMASPAGTEAKN